MSLAALCSLKNLHAAAARLYADAFAAKPALADDVPTGNRYNAARAAACAAVGEGQARTNWTIKTAPACVTKCSTG